MHEYEHKRRTRGLLFSPLVLGLLVVVVLVLVQATWGVFEKNRKSGEALRIAEERLERLTVRKERVSDALGALETESGVEAEIRDRFNVGREGERAIIIVEEDGSLSSAPPLPQSFLQKIWNFFTIK